MSIFNFWKRLRLSDPWRYKLPYILSVIYFMLSACNLDFVHALELLAASYVLMIGFAGFAYLLNDWSDIEKDKTAGKENFVGEMPIPARFIMLGVFISAICIPWFVLPFTSVSLCFLIAEICLFAIYSLPPLRLKERGLSGVIADALYAHVIPAAFAAYTYFLAGNQRLQNLTTFFLALSLWQAFMGIRNILLHQLEDFEKDKMSSTKTFATGLGFENTTKLIKYLFLPLETFAFIYLLIFLSSYSMVYAYFYALFLLFTLYKNRHVLLGKMDVRKFSYTFLDDFYLYWLPLSFIAVLSLHDYRFILLLLWHAVFFRTALHIFFRR